LAWYDTMTVFGQAAGKPVAVTENDMTSRPVWVGPIRLNGSGAAQIAHIEALLDSAAHGGYAFVVNRTSRDYPDLLAKIPRARGLAGVWAYTGLNAGDGADKPALAPWRAALRG
jgi:hypothetical protein